MDRFKRNVTGASFLVVPSILLVSFAIRPYFSDPGLSSGTANLAPTFNGGYGWVLVAWASPLIGLIFLEWMSALRRDLPTLSFVAGALGIVGCVMLAANKIALAMVPTALHTLTEGQFGQLLPAIPVEGGYACYLWMAGLYRLIPLALAMMTLALWQSRRIPRWQAVVIAGGSMLLISPNSGLQAAIASTAIWIGMIPMGLSILQSPKAAP
jgi:hypothetical protein